MRQFSRSFRIWHWLNAVAMFGLFITVVLRESVMHKANIGAIVQTKMAELGTIITDEQAVMIGKAVRSPMWDWHIYLGLPLPFYSFGVWVWFSKTDSGLMIIPRCKRCIVSTDSYME
jgi:cytochrome b561